MLNEMYYRFLELHEEVATWSVVHTAYHLCGSCLSSSGECWVFHDVGDDYRVGSYCPVCDTFALHFGITEFYQFERLTGEGNVLIFDCVPLLEVFNDF